MNLPDVSRRAALHLLEGLDELPHRVKTPGDRDNIRHARDDGHLALLRRAGLQSDLGELRRQEAPDARSSRGPSLRSPRLSEKRTIRNRPTSLPSKRTRPSGVTLTVSPPGATVSVTPCLTEHDMSLRGHDLSTVVHVQVPRAGVTLTSGRAQRTNKPSPRRATSKGRWVTLKAKVRQHLSTRDESHVLCGHPRSLGIHEMLAEDRLVRPEARSRRVSKMVSSCLQAGQLCRGT